MNDNTRPDDPANARGHVPDLAHGLAAGLAQTSPLRVLVALAAFVIVVQGMSAARTMIEPLLLSLLLAIGLAPAVGALVRRRVPVPLAILLVMLGVVAIGAAVGALVLQTINNFSLNLPLYEARLQAQVQTLGVLINNIHPAINTTTLTNSVDPGMAMDLARSLLGSFGNLISGGLLVLIIVIFLLLEATSLREKLHRATTHSHSVLNRFDRIAASVNHYLALKTLLSAANGVAIALWLWLVGVDHAPMWGVLMFLLNFVPGIGQTLAMVPILLMAWLEGGIELVLLAGAGGIVINTIIGNWLEPKYLGEGLGLSTFVVIMSLIVWGWVFGPVGMLLSVPLTMIAKIVFEANPSTHGIAVMLGNSTDAKESPPTINQPKISAANPPSNEGKKDVQGQ